MKKISLIKNKLINFGLATASIIITLLVLELAAQFYVSKIALQGKLFEPSDKLGWKVLPNLNFHRKNTDGQLWKIETNEDGQRGINHWKTSKAKKKILILGDSFAFGEGVDLEERFDYTLESVDYSPLNLGVMGYGTDQQYISSLSYLKQLDSNDLILVLTYYNDFYDVLHRSHSGRQKPWYEVQGDSLVLHSPKISLIEKLRDQSFLFAKINSILSNRQYHQDINITRSCKIYQHLLNSLGSHPPKIILAYHGIPLIKNPTNKTKVETSLTTICNNQNLNCLNLDEHFNTTDHPEYFLQDGHWNSSGHQLVGELLKKEILKRSSR